MKTLKYMIAAAIMSAALFTGCNKDNSLENSLTGTTADERTITYGTSDVACQLQIILPPAGALIKWDAGTITTNELIFNGANNYGEIMTQQQYIANDDRILNLFGTPVLGTVNVPYKMFSSASLTVELAPIPNLESSETGINHPEETNSLMLTGVCNIISPGAADRSSQTGIMPPMQSIPVTLIVKQRIALNSVWVNNVTVNNPGYTANLSLDLGQITNGITLAMLENAQMTNGTIVISGASNPDLYTMIMNNLQNITMSLELDPQNTNQNQLSAPASVAAFH